MGEAFVSLYGRLERKRRGLLMRVTGVYWGGLGGFLMIPPSKFSASGIYELGLWCVDNLILLNDMKGHSLLPLS